MQDEINFNAGSEPINWESRLGARVWDMLQNGWQGTDWFNAIRVKNALTQNHAVNLTGGTEMSKSSAASVIFTPLEILVRFKYAPNSFKISPLTSKKQYINKPCSVLLTKRQTFIY